MTENVYEVRDLDNAADERWAAVMCGRSRRLKEQISTWASLTFVLNRHEASFTCPLLPATSNVLALVVHNTPTDDIRYSGVEVTGWRLRPEGGILVANSSTWVLRKSISHRHGIDPSKDSVLREVALEIETARRAVVETKLEIDHLQKRKRQARDERQTFASEDLERLSQLQAEMAEARTEPRFPRLLAGLNGIDPRTDLELEEFLVMPTFRRAIIDLARNYYDRAALRTDELCATTPDGLDLDMLWELLLRRIGSGGLDALVDQLLQSCTSQHGFLTFFPADLLPAKYAPAAQAQFIDLSPVLRSTGAGPCRSRVFTWDFRRVGQSEGLRFELPGIRADFSHVPPRYTTSFTTTSRPTNEAESVVVESVEAA